MQEEARYLALVRILLQWTGSHRFIATPRSSVLHPAVIHVKETKCEIIIESIPLYQRNQI